MSARLRAGLLAALAVGAFACGEEKPTPGYVPLPGTGGTGGTGGPITTSGGGGGDPACEVPGGGGASTGGPASGGGTSGGSTSGGSTKFDVGVGTGGGVDLPVSCDELDSARSNLGCEFWAVDLPNDWNGTTFSPPAADQPFAVVVANTSALQPATVSVYAGADTTPIDTAEVEVDGTHRFELLGQDINPMAGSADGVAFRIESDVPITAYQFNPLDNTNPTYSNDSSVLFPAHALGTDHVVVTGDGILLSMGPDDPSPAPAGAFVSVVATVDGTQVDVKTSAMLQPGPTEGVTLDRGQVLTVVSDGAATENNLTGTRVLADQPVAVFGGNVATGVPANGGACCADHLEHQMLPITAWGTAYVVVPPPATKGSGDDRAVFHVVAAFDGSELGYCPTRPSGAPNDLQGFRDYSFETRSPFVVRSLDPDKPVLVVEHLMSNEASDDGSTNGDPAMIVLPPIAQFQRKYVFAVPDGYTGGNYVTVVTSDPSDVRLDGTLLDAADFSEAAVYDGRMYHYAHVPVDPGAHVLQAGRPAGIVVVGYDEAVSHGYPGGAGLDIIAVPPVAG